MFTPDGLDERAALDDQSAFIASLGSTRSDRMRDVLGTIQADQDAVIRTGSQGALVVDGGPGTGKTVVALHRAAYLLYADPRLRAERGGVLVVGPSRPYLSYVADVLPSLGEEGVRTCTLRDLVPQGATVTTETDPEVAGLKASADLVAAIEPAVRFHEEPPTTTLTVSTPWTELQLTAADWGQAFDVVEPGTPHNEARDRIWEELLTLLLEKYDGQSRSRGAAGRSGGQPGPAGGLDRGVAAGVCGRSGVRPLVGARLPAAVRAGPGPRRGAPPAAVGPESLDGVGPSDARRGPTAAR